MRFVFLNYGSVAEFDRPEAWLHRIRGYTGILEALSRQHEVVSIEQISYRGDLLQNGVQYHFLNFDKPAPSRIGETAQEIKSWEHLKSSRRTNLSRGRSALRDIILARKINRFVATLKPDIVFVHGMLFPLQVILLKRQLGTNVKIIVQNHAEKPGRRYKKFFQRIADRSVDAYLFAAKEMGLEWVQEGIVAQDSKIREVMEASSVFAPSDRAAAKTQTGVQGGLVFLWVGRLDENKDPLTVVKAFLQFARGRPEACLYMIFHTDELLSEIKTLLAAVNDQAFPEVNIHDENDTERSDPEHRPVVLVGKITHEEMGHWYNSADFILSGSHYEGSGVAVCEAMSCGCIPVVTDILSFRVITGRGSCGILYEAGNEAALLEALTRASLLDRAKEKEKVLARFRSYLSFEAIAAQIGQIAGDL